MRSGEWLARMSSVTRRNYLEHFSGVESEREPEWYVKVWAKGFNHREPFSSEQSLWFENTVYFVASIELSVFVNA